METLWDRARQGFEKILQEAEKTAERVVDSFEELSDYAKARIDQAQLERTLFKRFAELGSALYEVRKKGGSDATLLSDPNVKKLLEQVSELDAELKEAESRAQRTK